MSQLWDTLFRGHEFHINLVQVCEIIKYMRIMHWAFGDFSLTNVTQQCLFSKNLPIPRCSDDQTAVR